MNLEINYLAQIDVTNILNNGTTAANNIAEGWDKQWIDLLQNNTDNNIYGVLTKLGIFFAVGTLLVFMTQWLRDLMNILVLYLV